MAKPIGLFQKGRTWYLRARVPKDVQPYFKTKTVMKSLKTRDYNDALKRIHTVRAGIEAEFEKVRKRQQAKASGTDVLSGYSDLELHALVTRWFQLVKATDAERRRNDVSKWSDEEIRDYRKDIAQEEWIARQEVAGTSQNEKHDGLTTAVEFLESEGISYKTDSKNFRKLGHIFSVAILELAQHRLRELEGVVHIPQFDVSTASLSAIPKNRIKMGDLMEKYLSNPRVSRAAGTVKNYRLIGRAIKEVIGNETFVDEVTREQCRVISEILLKLPSNAHKKIKFETLADAVRIGKEKSLPVLSDNTFNTYMHKFHALFDYAVRETYMPQNPAKGLTVQSIMKAKDRRHPFTLDQLKGIFNSDLYRTDRPHALLYNPKARDNIICARYWLPLIGLWSGMRLNEICQLEVNDIVRLDNVWVVRVNEESDGQRLKTENAERIVPIHPFLVRAGLIDYVDSARNAKQSRLFPDLKLSTRGLYSDAVGKWFSRYLKENKVKTERTSFHSLRHTFRDATRVANIPRETVCLLGGWSEDGATDADYGSGIGTKDLYTELRKISYEGLDLSHLCK